MALHASSSGDTAVGRRPCCAPWGRSIARHFCLRLGGEDIAISRCIIAIAYDAQLAPVDARSLRLEDSRDNGTRLWLEIDLAKSGRDALATLSRRTQAPVPGPRATRLPPHRRRRRSSSLARDSLAEDFGGIRKLLFPGDGRQLQDARCTGAVEARRGRPERHLPENGAHGRIVGASPEDLPVNQTALELADEARKGAADGSREQGGGKS